MSEPRIGVYPGTFDPITNGHLDIISRATRVLDRLVIGIAENAGKGPLFTIEERVAMVEAEVAAMTNGDGSRIEVRPFNTLLMNFVIGQGATLIVRGLRAVSDFEFEFQMAGMNRRMNPMIETVFLMASDRHQLIASRLVKEVAELGGDIGQFVSPRVKQKLAEKLGTGA
ncbi:pantetheine-phosphate adenylyltransferase [Shumkonia mesophila]|uniref:pantetheine-phosphate adenylyltransferase n=1 Tax=Shumkonia mesophila TaxID=2838854 RepID=UPI00293518C4|nr:pantetheine-phosphate adenylyltransferase [Shumkonia mesophila]